MRPRLLLVLLSVVLAAMSIAPAAAAPAAATHDGTDKECDDVVTAAGGIPVVLGGLLDSVGDVAPTSNAALPLGIGGCTGVRPGATVVSETGLCSFNYLFTGSDGHRYMGTAGHCILGLSGGEQTWAPGTGPVAMDGMGTRVGEFAYAVLGGVRDFALVRLDDGVDASGQVCHFGGPTGINDDLTTAPVVLEHFGQGVVLGELVPGRTAVSLSMDDPDQVFATGVALFGDSGGPVNSADGRAVGVLVTVGLHLGGLTNAGLIGVTRLSPQLAQAEDNLGISLQLVTAPRG